tara:strand:- start:2764 stop:3501 length:738 start_codon:yes stop_codon:yes gene_type:complete
MLDLELIKSIVTSDVFKGVAAVGGVFISALVALYYRQKARRAYRKGSLPEEVKVVCNIFEDNEDGTTTHKPRTSESPQPIARAFPNPVMAEKIVAATTRCDASKPGGAFIMMNDPADQQRFVKVVRDIASEQGGDGQLARQYDLPVVKKVGYACVTFAPDGDQRKVRIDLISSRNLKRFCDSEFVQRLTNRQDEGSHDDLEAIFSFAAEREYAKHPHAAFYAIRVSHAFTAIGVPQEIIDELSDE